jgi:DNA repair photolyase
MTSKFKIKEIRASSIITKSNLPATDYVINPYVGCLHSCIYCYAVFMKRFTNHYEKWGTFIDVKINGPELVPKNTEKYKNKFILLSSVTDAYLPLEKKYQLTRKILHNLIPLEPKLGIQTKSNLVLRDLDLLKQFKDCEVGFTITTLDDNIRKKIEPLASSISQRISALEKLHSEKINTYVFIGPIMPFLTDWKKIILNTKHCVNTFMFENLNVNGIIWNSLRLFLNIYYPELLKEYEKICFTKNNYWKIVEQDIKSFCKTNNINCKIYFHH